ncbi:DUF3644 domain-containing protein [Pseudidiomarina sp. YC-516-91]|uniref:DUF3644 domain-containing protein n=1 Tax=Pseudidiomarina salilacus TaxID=3384452 RepID=UPI0039852CF5
MPQQMRRVGSIKAELVKKSREAALTAVQVFNNPNIGFKSESYIVLMIIAWTYLLHAYYRGKGIEYRYYRMAGQRKKFDKTKHGAHKYWDLERCLNDAASPIDRNVANNLKFLIGLRHEIEHQMTTKIDDLLSARFQASALNFNQSIKALFGPSYGIERHLSFSLQFSSITEEQREMLEQQRDLPANIKSYIQSFDKELSDEEFSSSGYAYRILFVPKTANRRGQADRVIEFVKADSELASKVNKDYVVLKDVEKKKYLPSEIVRVVNNEGFPRFKIHHHTSLWQSEKAKAPQKGYGVQVAKTWYWYDNWLQVVKDHCRKNRRSYE